MLPLGEHSCTVYLDWAYYGPVPGGETEAKAKGGIEVVGTGWFGFGGDADIALGGGTYERGGETDGMGMDTDV